MPAVAWYCAWCAASSVLHSWMAGELACAAPPSPPDCGIPDAACEAGVKLHLQYRGAAGRREERRQMGRQRPPATSSAPT